MLTPRTPIEALRPPRPLRQDRRGEADLRLSFGGYKGSSGGYLVACGTPTHVAFFGTKLTRQVHRRRRAKLELSLFASQLEIDHIVFGTVSGLAQRGDLAARETIGADPILSAGHQPAHRRAARCQHHAHRHAGRNTGMILARPAGQQVIFSF